MSVSSVGPWRAPLTTTQYLSVMRNKYASMIDELEVDYLKPHPLGNLKPLAELSALAMPLLDMKLNAALQLNMQTSIYTIEVFL